MELLQYNSALSLTPVKALPKKRWNNLNHFLSQTASQGGPAQRQKPVSHPRGLVCPQVMLWIYCCVFQTPYNVSLLFNWWLYTDVSVYNKVKRSKENSHSEKQQLQVNTIPPTDQVSSAHLCAGCCKRKDGTNTKYLADSTVYSLFDMIKLYYIFTKSHFTSLPFHFMPMQFGCIHKKHNNCLVERKQLIICWAIQKTDCSQTIKNKDVKVDFFIGIYSYLRTDHVLWH